jgi:putative IMPACT (imprinted ancient) family translation regulator
LINAYKSAAGSALKNSEIIDRVVYETCEIYFPFATMNDVMTIIKEENIIQSNHSFDLECVIKVLIRSSIKEKVISRFSRIEGFKYRFLESM